MAEEAPPLVTDEAAERSLVDDVRQLVEDGRTLVEAELAYQKSRAVVAGQAAKSVAAWAALALAMAFFALMALVLGLILILTSLIGPIGAALAVVMGLLFLAGVTGMMALRRWQRAAALLADEGAQP